jgi:hypothetical protein
VHASDQTEYVHKSLLSSGAIVLGGLEAYAPNVLNLIAMPHDQAVVLFYGGLAYLVPGLMKGAQRRRGEV